MNVDRTAKEKTHKMINTYFYFYKYFTEQISEYNKKLRIKWRIQSPLNIIVVLQKYIIHHRFVHIAVELFRFVLNILVKIKCKPIKSWNICENIENINIKPDGSKILLHKNLPDYAKIVKSLHKSDKLVMRAPYREPRTISWLAYQRCCCSK